MLTSTLKFSYKKRDCYGSQSQTIVISPQLLNKNLCTDSLHARTLTLPSHSADINQTETSNQIILLPNAILGVFY